MVAEIGQPGAVRCVAEKPGVSQLHNDSRVRLNAHR